jgi:hypothetical protein
VSTLADPAVRGLQLQIDQLAAQVRQLQAAAQGDEALQPTYLTVDNQGRVSASFSGVVTALGLTLPAFAGSTPAATNQIQWLRTSDQALVARLAAGETNPAPGSIDELLLQLQQTNTANQTILQLNAQNPVGTAQGPELQLLNTPGQPTNTAARVIMQPASTVYTLIDGNSQSSFPQLTGALHQQLIDDNNGNFYTITFPGPLATNTSASASFNSAHTGWASGIPIGALTPGNWLVWSYSYTAPSTWTIVVTNTSPYAMSNVSWVGYVIGH